MTRLGCSQPLLAKTTEPEEHEAAVQTRACCLLIGIVFASVSSLGVAALCSEAFPIILGHAALAFALGLRHAVDCDHLAAIDNVTRQLLSRGQMPVSVGFWFAVGHSTIVVAMTAILAGGYAAAWSQIKHSEGITTGVSLVAAIFSMSLLLGIGLLNAKLAVDLLRTQTGAAAKSHSHEEEEVTLGAAISLIPCLRRAFAYVDKPHKMYGIGLLFGLSFDTATQVALIGLAAIAGTNQRVPPLMVMIFPLCFSCGMCLVDTANGLLMLLTYSWAQVDPDEKVLYNLVVTGLSAFVALSIASLEILQIVQQQFGLAGPFWDALASVNMASLGYGVITLFAATLLSVFVWSRCRTRTSPNDSDAAGVEQRWSAGESK